MIRENGMEPLSTIVRRVMAALKKRLRSSNDPTRPAHRTRPIEIASRQPSHSRPPKGGTSWESES